MARNLRLAFIFGITLIVFLASLYHNLLREEISGDYLRESPVDFRGQYDNTQSNANYAIQEEASHRSSRHVSSVSDSISTISVLLLGWDVLVVVSPETPFSSGTRVDDYTCLFQNNDTTPARQGRSLTFNRTTFKCEFPRRVRRHKPYLQPILKRSTEAPPDRASPLPQLNWWNFIVYESLSTENDVILFAKGLNNRQGTNRSPTEFRCVFGDDAVKTAVTSSIQEVFRCKRPQPSALSSSDSTDEEERIKISLEISNENRVLPSVAYHTARRKVANAQQKSLICACTMVYNVAKYLREWIVYHSKIGVEKFILYDNDSDDDLEKVVEELVRDGYNVTTLFWIWPKTQEAGFSHCAVYAKDSCTWMMYIDVDEFVYSPVWLNSSQPSNHMLSYLLPRDKDMNIGQVMMNCYEFGPSNQNSHPVLGVTQGYNCRKVAENRHKSIVLLEAIDESLLNVVHHFQLKESYRSKKYGTHKVAVNHYKYQAWPEFKAKFRRRVSAYVVDWTRSVNLMSKDRAPGLGFAPVEPIGWPQKFCEVYDDRLKEMTQRWFGLESPSGHQMAWQR